MSSTTQLPKHFKTELSSSYSKKGGRPTLARFLLIFTILCQKHANSHHFALLSFQTLTNVLATARGLWGALAGEEENFHSRDFSKFFTLTGNFSPFVGGIFNFPISRLVVGLCIVITNLIAKVLFSLFENFQNRV